MIKSGSLCPEILAETIIVTAADITTVVAEIRITA